ncbi:MAG TPA: GNAT family N-acetyltransferase [Roseomonas sp.]|jgi:ribosomal protein S18 acetylase RimI-like enzyme
MASDSFPFPGIGALERAALTAVPAPRVAFDGPFVLRAFRGGTSRANAVSALDPRPDPDMPARVARIEALHGALGLPLRFRSTPLDPEGLAAFLRARGYTEKDETVVLAGLLAPIARPDPAVAVLEAPSPDWMAVIGTAEYQTEARRAEKLDSAPLLLATGGWLLLREDDADAACAAVVVDGGLAGAFDLAVQPAFRRRGLARRILQAGAAWAGAQGAHWLYAQVAAGNAASLATFAGLGFQETYRYRYFLPAR